MIDIVTCLVGFLEGRGLVLECLLGVVDRESKFCLNLKRSSQQKQDESTCVYVSIHESVLTVITAKIKKI